MNLNKQIPNWILLLVMACILAAGASLGFILKIHIVGVLFTIPVGLLIWTAISHRTKEMAKNNNA